MPEEYDFDHLPINRATRVRMARDAIRQQRRREQMRGRHAPDTHAVDRAVSQAVARVVTRNLQTGGDHSTVTLNYSEVGAEAIRILMCRYARAEAKRAVAERIRPRRKHLWDLPPPRNQD